MWSRTGYDVAGWIVYARLWLPASLPLPGAMGRMPCSLPSRRTRPSSSISFSCTTTTRRRSSTRAGSFRSRRRGSSSTSRWSRSSSRSSCRAGATLRYSSSASSARSMFWAGKLHVDGPLDVNARLLTVPPGDDADGDYFPDATDFPAHVPEAATLYANHADVLDCNDKDNMPTAADGTPLVLMAKDIN